MICPICNARLQMQRATDICCSCHHHKVRQWQDIVIDAVDHDRGPHVWRYVHPEIWLCSDQD